MRQHFRIAVSIVLCFLFQTQGVDKYTDENRPYEFGFEVNVEGTKQQHRHEEKDKDGIIKGEFGFITADDVYHVTVYATDKDGHFKILSMKNIHLKSSASAGGASSSARQGHSLALPASTRALNTATTSAKTTSAPAIIANNVPPLKNVALQPQIAPKPIPKPSLIRSCSSCSIPTTTQKPPLAAPVNNFGQNSPSYPVSTAPSLNNLLNSDNQPVSPNLEPPSNQIRPQQPSGLSNEQLNRQVPNQSTYPIQSFSNTQQAIQSSIPHSQQGISNSLQNFPNQQTQSHFQQGISNSVQNFPNQQTQSLSQQGISNSVQNYRNQQTQSSYPQQEPPAPYNTGLISQQPGPSSYPVQDQSGLAYEEPQQTSHSSYPVQENVVPGSVQPKFRENAQSSYPGEQLPITYTQHTTQQPSQQGIYPAGGVPSGAGSLSQQPNQPTYPIQKSLISSPIESQPNPVQFSNSGGTQPNLNQRALSGERTSKQYKGLKEIPTPGQMGQVKPKLVSVDMQIVDKNTDIHALQPGEKQGLPDGLNEHDMSRLLYVFNYTVGFHGHYEEGYENGVKKGYYYVTGRNGVKTRIDYIADSTGFHPKMSQEVLDLVSDDVPKPETEKDAKYGLKSYEFKWLYYPVGS